MAYSAGKILKKTGAWLLRITGFLLLLLLLVWGLLQTQWGKNIVKNVAVKYLQKKLQTNVSINGLTVEWLSHIHLKGVNIEDRQKRKLVSVQDIDLKYDVSSIFKSRLTIKDIDIRSATIQLFRNRKDSIFNFSFIAAAFADSTQKQATKTSSFQLGLGKISLSKFNFLVDDQYGGQVYQLSLASFTTSIDAFDLEKLHMHAKYLFTDSVNCAVTFSQPYNQSPKITTDNTANPSTLLVTFDSIGITHTLFNFENKDTHFKIKTNAELLASNNILYDQARMNVTLGDATLLDHTTKVNITSNGEPAKNMSPENKDSTKPFTYSIKSIAINRNNVEFNDDGAPASKQKQVDVNHLSLKDIVINASNTGYDGKAYSAEINQIKLNEKSGFKLQQLKANVRYSDTGVSLKKLVLNTAQNQLQGDVDIAYKATDKITTRPGDTKINAVISNSHIQLDELLYFQPALSKNKSFKPLLGKKFYINTTVKGSLDKLNIPSLSIKESQTFIQASANIYNLPDIKKLLIDLKLKEFSGTRNDLLSFLPPNTIPDSLLHYLPQKFTLRGSYKGTMNDLYTDLQLNTSEGNATLKGTLKNITDKKNAVYDVSASTDNLQLGKLMQDSLIGNLSANIQLKGKGYDLPTAIAQYDAAIEEANYKGYTYHDVKASGNINNNKLEAHLQSKDPNIEISSDTYYDMNKSKGSFKTETTIANADLMKLGFLKDTMVIKGKLSADIPILDSAQLNGKALATNLNIQYAGHLTKIDTVSLNATYVNNLQTINITTPVVDMTLKGHYTLQALPAAAKTITNRYLYTNSKDTAYTRSIAANLNASVHVPDSMLFLIPGLKSISPFSIVSSINTDSSSLSFITNINKIKYAGYEIDTLQIAAINKPSGKELNEIAYGVTVQSVTSPSFNLAKTFVEGNINRGIINGKLELLDESEKPKYIFPYSIVNDSAKPYLRVGDSLLINKNNWAVNNNNIIYLNMAALKGSNLQISNKDESFGFAADSTQNNGLPLNVNFQHFRLKNISDMLTSDSSLVEGETNGIVSIKSISPFSFTSDLMIDSLRLKEVNAGNLSIQVSQQTDNNLVADIALKGMDNDVTLNGTYNATEKKTALKLDMKQFNLRNIEPFSSAYLGKLTGKLKGGLTINGTLESPEIRGVIKTDSAQAISREYGTSIFLPAEEIIFDEKGIKFNQFNFKDSAGNKGAISGTVFTTNYLNYRLDLKLDTKGFLVIGRKKFSEQMIYGPTWADALINIKGTEKNLMVDGSVTIKDKSEFTYVNSSTGTSQNGEGLIEFFDPTHPLDSAVINAIRKKAASTTQLGLNMYLNATPGSNFTIVLDELSGDQLKINGTAAINFTMSPGGQMSMTGNYVAESGNYDLSIAGLLKKQFIIKKGSTITWTGDPLMADMNITALYKVKTSAGELVNDIQSVPGIDKQQLNFEVYLLLTKKMLKPDINFRLDMPEDQQEAFNGIIYTRLKQINLIPSELNKQVMGLLTVNHFIADNPFSSLSTTGSSIQTQAYTTAGKLVTQELTDLLGNSIKGVDINFDLDVNEDYTNGSAQRTTDLKVGMKKSLANERLTIYVGSTIPLEGHSQNSVEGLAGDFTVEYLLSTDGKYRIKAYSINESAITFEGSYVKTGVTFVVVLEFNKVKNMFDKPKKSIEKK